MGGTEIDQAFPAGLLRPELFLGVASSIAAQTVGVNLSEAGRPSGSHFQGGRYGRGEVGEFVLIEGQKSLLLGRISEVRLREAERRSITRDFSGASELDALGRIQLLGCVAVHDLRVTAGVDSYPRLGDRIYAAPHSFIAMLPQLMESESDEAAAVTLDLGTIRGTETSTVSVKPERLLGRHCAILGATGGGKSWTTARIVEQCARYKAKLILVDATGEYRSLSGSQVRHRHLGEPVDKAAKSVASQLPPTCFMESDLLALFEPAGRVQGPKLRAAIRSLRLAALRPRLAEDGIIKKMNRSKIDVEAAEREPDVAGCLDDPSQSFDVSKLPAQIEEECVYPDGFGARRGEKDTTKWGGEDGNFYALPVADLANQRCPYIEGVRVRIRRWTATIVDLRDGQVPR